ncbi:MAG: malto-oligosyltrehalose trehalohydrolase, partial [bacterium]
MSILRKIGAHVIDEAKTEFVVWAPHAKEISVEIVDPHKSSIPLLKKDYGYWSNILDVGAGTRYFYSIDRNKPLPDPASVFQPEGVHGSSEVVDLSKFPWEDQGWKNIPLKDYVIYELHTGTFSEKSNFEGIIEKISYLKELGVTAIEIMPVGQFPGNRNWGYDGVYPFAVQNSYGGPLGLQKLVNECHKNNLAVILDVIYNHLGPEGNYLAQFAPYFTKKYSTPWGEAVNFDDAYSDGVRNYVIQNSLMWMKDFHIDGLRLDAIHAIEDFSAYHIMKELSFNKNKLEKNVQRPYYLIAESNLNDAKYIDDPGKGGYGLDTQWSDDFHHCLHTLVTGENFGYYKDYRGINDLAKSFKDVFVYDGVYSEFRKRTFGNSVDGHPGDQFVVFAQNHDQTGNRLKGDRISTLVDFESLKLVAGAVFISPYLPMIFMGEEYGETNPFLYFISHTDPDLVNAVREGRKKEFEGYFEEDFYFDPQDEATFNQSRLQFTFERDMNSRKLFEFYKALIFIKKNHPVISSSNRKNIKVDVLS